MRCVTLKAIFCCGWVLKQIRAAFFVVTIKAGFNKTDINKIAICAAAMGVMAIAAGCFTLLNGVPGWQIQLRLLYLVATETLFGLKLVIQHRILLDMGLVAVVTGDFLLLMSAVCPMAPG